MFFDFEACRKFLEEAVTHYEASAPTVSQYCDELYIRLGDSDRIDLTEITTIQQLKENDCWEQPNYAANRVYKLRDSLGQSTVGMIDH